jgi:hypothetical protein
MGYVIIDVCPQCRSDVSRRFGLIKTPLIGCRKCGYTMRVTPNAVRNNWQYNFAVVAMLFFWLVLAGIVVLNPKGAMRFVSQLGSFKNLESHWPLAVMSFVPAFILALPFAMLGRIMGIATASRLPSRSQENSADDDLSALRFSSAPASGGQKLQSQQWQPQLRATPAAPDPASPPLTDGGGVGIGKVLLRILFGVLWMVVFFVLGSFSITAVVMALESGDQEARQQAVEAAGRAAGVPLFFGSIGLVIVLALLGWLPGFRKRKVGETRLDASLLRSKPSDSRVIAGR